MLVLNQIELKEVSGGHCMCHCSVKPGVDPLVSSMDECMDWCRQTNHGVATGCDGSGGIHVEGPCNIL